MTTRRLSVLDAAEHLGVSVNAVRMRIRRGTLASEKDEDGNVWVLVSDYSPDDSETTRKTSEATSGQVEDLREQIAYLKEIISTRDEEIRRRDHIIAALTERIPELEAPPQTPQEAQEAAEAPQNASEGADRDEVRETRTEVQSGGEQERVPWWRRWFGGS